MTDFQNEFTYTVIRSKRKTVTVEVTRDFEVILRVPLETTDEEAALIAEKKSTWIKNTIEKMKARTEERENSPDMGKLTAEDIKALSKKALEVIPARVRYYSKLVGVNYGRITVRNLVSRWGSCSEGGNLGFNCLLMLCPPEVVDYVVVHELCHIVHMNHSEEYWAEVERVMPDYKEHKSWLDEHGGEIIDRMRKK
ncbi:MAG: M48 family metallopeptidase [Firmicutes bacterium]|nr:M48 family metallopeptidase [Bacillota bacterium]MCD7787890.1 M48 family metallopeptidase [Bacillota bacterium]MCD7831338.1 M48 family metallopeptidase [Bacillota bacterium]